MALKDSCGGRVSCQKIGTTLAATTTAHCLWCISVLFAYFIFSSSLFIPSECSAVWKSSRVVSMRLPPRLGFYLWVLLSCSMVNPSWLCQLVGRQISPGQILCALTYPCPLLLASPNTRKFSEQHYERDLAGKSAPVKVLLLCKDEGQRLQQCQCMGVWVLPLMFWWSRHMLSAFLLERWLISSWNCPNAKWWIPEKASFINCAWVTEDGSKTWFLPRREKALTVWLCSGLNERSGAHVVFISDAPLKCLQVLGL